VGHFLLHVPVLEWGHVSGSSKSGSSAKSEPVGSEFQNFTDAVKKIMSVSKADLDLHKPIRPRNGANRPKRKSKS